MAKSYRAIALAVLACFSTPLSGRAAQLRFESGSAYLGSFSTLDPLDSAVSPAGIAVRIRADRDWRLEIRFREPLRRTADGLALPTARAPRGAAQPIISLEPHVVLLGSGSRESGEVFREWRELPKAIEAYLDRGDPPGTYQGTLLARLLDTSGAPLTDYVSMSIQFDIARWVEIVDHDVPDFSVAVRDEVLDAESPIAAVRLASNTSWTLFVSGEQKPEPRKKKDGGLALSSLSACAPTEGQGGWRLLKSACVPLGAEPQALIAGDAPPPFSVSNQEIPIVVRHRTAHSVPAGAYGAAVRFTARIGQPP